MDINFMAYQPDKFTIYLKDYTSINQHDIPEQIFSMTLDIKSGNIPNGRIDEPIDLLAYMFSSSRQDDTLYIITSDILGFGESQEIPDGTYEFTYAINNRYVITHKFLVYMQVEEDVNNLLQTVGYNVEIGDYDIDYAGDYSTYDVEKVRLASTLLDELRSYAMVDDEEKVLSSLDKLRRLLGLIENEIV